jgi:hypothetical protein
LTFPREKQRPLFIDHSGRLNDIQSMFAFQESRMQRSQIKGPDARKRFARRCVSAATGACR